jgi:hypothetical protein
MKALLILSMLLCGCVNQSVRTMVMPEREMSIYRLESRIERLESYDKKETKAECDMLRRQISALRATK